MGSDAPTDDDGLEDYLRRAALIDDALEGAKMWDVFLLLTGAAGEVLADFEAGTVRNRARRDFCDLLRKAEKQAVIDSCDA
jgi:hypothetical protein